MLPKSPTTLCAQVNASTIGAVVFFRPKPTPAPAEIWGSCRFSLTSPHDMSDHAARADFMVSGIGSYVTRRPPIRAHSPLRVWRAEFHQDHPAAQSMSASEVGKLFKLSALFYLEFYSTTSDSLFFAKQLHFLFGNSVVFTCAEECCSRWLAPNAILS